MCARSEPPLDPDDDRCRERGIHPWPECVGGRCDRRPAQETIFGRAHLWLEPADPLVRAVVQIDGRLKDHEPLLEGDVEGAVGQGDDLALDSAPGNRGETW